MAKRFFYACAGILCLAFAYHLGAVSAVAQGPSGKIRHVEAWGDRVWVVTDSDDIYVIDAEKLRDVSKGAGWTKFNLDAVK